MSNKTILAGKLVRHIFWEFLFFEIFPTTQMQSTMGENSGKSSALPINKKKVITLNTLYA